MSILDKYLNIAAEKVTTKLDKLASKLIEGDAPSSIDKFRSTLSAGLARPNQFITNFILPSYVSTNLLADIKSIFGVSTFDSNLSLLCNEVTIPSRKLNTTSIKFNGMTRKAPTNYEWDDITISFIDTNEHLAYKIFSKWMDGVTNPYTNTGKFYDDYTSDIKVNLLNKNNETTSYFVLNKAYPTSILEIPLSWDSEEGYNKIQITFNYLYQSDKDYSSMAIYNMINNMSTESIKNNFKNIGDSVNNILGSFK